MTYMSPMSQWYLPVHPWWVWILLALLALYVVKAAILYVFAFAGMCVGYSVAAFRAVVAPKAE